MDPNRKRLILWNVVMELNDANQAIQNMGLICGSHIMGLIFGSQIMGVNRGTLHNKPWSQ